MPHNLGTGDAGVSLMLLARPQDDRRRPTSLTGVIVQRRPLLSVILKTINEIRGGNALQLGRYP